MIIDLLANNGYIVLNKTVMKVIGLHEAILLGELCSEYVYWRKRDELEDGYFYSTRENIEEQTMLSVYQQRKAIKNLKKKEILETKEFGMPLKTWYFINEEKLYEIVAESGLKSSSVKTAHQDVKKLHDKSLKNLTSSSVETTQHDVQKLHTNNNKNNKIDRLFNYIINKEEKIPEEFVGVGDDKIVDLLEKYDMLYNQNVIDLYTKENLEKVKVITYIVALIAKDNLEHLSNNVSRDMLIRIYDVCREKERCCETSESKINDFVMYYYKSVVNELVKENRTNFRRNRRIINKNEDEEDLLHNMCESNDFF